MLLVFLIILFGFQSTTLSATEYSFMVTPKRIAFVIALGAIGLAYTNFSFATKKCSGQKLMKKLKMK